MRREMFAFLICAIVLSVVIVIPSRAITRDEPGPTVVALIPHQDDEMVMAGHLNRYVREGKNVFVMLVTDGSASKARAMINGASDSGEKEYSVFFGKYHNPRAEGYAELTTDSFVAARNREFMSSMRKLGIPTSNLIFIGMPDDHVTVSSVSTVLDEFADKFKNALFVTLVAPTSSQQHPDHRAIYEALRSNTHITQKLYFSEIPEYGTPDELTTREMLAKKKSLDAYRYWDPPSGRFAIGMHSVKTRLDAWSKEKYEYVVQN